MIGRDLLAFIQHAIDTMDEVSIVKICKSDFKKYEICSDKVLLYQSLGKAEQMPTRWRVRRVQSLQDIITLMKETDPGDVPSFVRKE